MTPAIATAKLLKSMPRLLRRWHSLLKCCALAGSTDARNARKHIHQTQSLSRDLPVTWPSSIFVVQDENRFSALKCATCVPHACVQL